MTCNLALAKRGNELLEFAQVVKTKFEQITGFKIKSFLPVRWRRETPGIEQNSDKLHWYEY